MNSARDIDIRIFHCFYCLCLDILLRILHASEQNRTLIVETKAELEKFKQHVLVLLNASLMSTNIEAAVVELLQEPFQTLTDLEEFCNHINDDRVFRKKRSKLTVMFL